MIELGSISKLSADLERKAAQLRAAEQRNQAEMLDQAQPVVVVGAHGQRVLGSAIPDAQLQVDEFPKIYPQGLQLNRPKASEARRVADEVLAESLPIEMRNAAGVVTQVQGTPLPPQYADWQVTWLGGSHWRIGGGRWRYTYVLEDGITTAEEVFEVKPLEVSASEGWVVLALTGHIQFTTAISPFKITDTPKLRVVKQLATDYSLTLDGGTASAASASYGMLPVAYIAAPGRRSAWPMILGVGRPFGSGEQIRPNIHFNTWGNRDV